MLEPEDAVSEKAENSLESRIGRGMAWAAAWLLPWYVLGVAFGGYVWGWPAPGGVGGIGLGCSGVLAFLVLFIRGLDGAPEGWGSWPYTFALGAALTEFLLGTQSMIEGFRQGMGEAGILPPAPPRPQDPYAFWSTLFVTFALGLLFHRLLVRRREAQTQARLLEEARRQALQSKLAPHFIFNALNTLHAQIEGDPRGAQATTERLAQLFRQVVEMAGRPTVPLGEELAFVEAYLGIEQARLGDRLRVEIDVPEELEGALVPPLALQVLAENAVKHGVAARAEEGRVRIRARRLGPDLQVEVLDSGPGLGAHPGTGTALATLRQRLARPEDLEIGATDEGFRAAFHWRQA